MTVCPFIIERQRDFPEPLENLQLCSVRVYIVQSNLSAAQRAGVYQKYGLAGEINLTEHHQKELDDLLNDVFVKMLGASFNVCGMVSEENEKVIKVPAPNEKQGKYILCFDP